ncbi:archease [Fervidobacterium changbaicum]|uniref:archease n=1 Tax=Fervidobacterium changbaicum TaxID=310769 RepID=UPI0015A3348B|nr:archease [Fervidobacterium changbaicum]
MKNNLFREISHTADLAYEIVAKDLTELLNDIVQIIMENSDFSEGYNGNASKSLSHLFKECSKKDNKDLQNVIKKCYNISDANKEGFIDDLFDAVNDIISTVDRGYLPVKVENQCVYFTKRRVALRIKALTYHGLQVEFGEKITLRVVFDV